MKAKGLEGIVVAQTRLSAVDGERGRLTLGGYDVEEIAGRISFEGIVSLLATGAFPDAVAARAVRERIGRAREEVFARLHEMGDALEAQDGMDALLAALAHLKERALRPPSLSAMAGALFAHCAPPTPGPAPELRELVVAAPAVVAAAWWRRRQGESPVAPDPELGHAADFLRMVTGRPPHPVLARALETYLVTVSDHGMNASTFTARVVASTGSDLVSAIVAATCALKGPLHGGAPGPVLDMLDAVRDPSHAEAWIRNELRRGNRIMGMGHRIYRVRDPRAAVLERAVERLERAGVSSGRLALARAVERVAADLLREKHPGRALAANVEFYTAVLLDTVGLPRELFSPAFAAGRVAGWCAHYAEQRAEGRLIRPESEYVGPTALKVPA